MTRWLLGGGAVAGPAFVATFLVEGARRPGYDPFRHPVSALALGPRGRVQAANFVTAGTLVAGLAAGLVRSRSGRPAELLTAAGLAAVGAGFLGSAVFPTDPVNGYPPGAPALGGPSTTTGNLHILAGVPVLLGFPVLLAAGAWDAARDGRRGWAAVSAGSAIVSAAGVAGAGAAFSGPGAPDALVRVGGLFQRCALVTDLAWTSAVAVRALRRKI